MVMYTLINYNALKKYVIHHIDLPKCIIQSTKNEFIVGL